MAKLLDANVVIRYLTSDDPKKGRRFELLLTTEKGALILTDVVMAEIVWTLESYYRASRQMISTQLQTLLTASVIEANRPVLIKALSLYATISIDYIDAYLIAYQEVRDIEFIVSYDRDIDKVKTAKRMEP